MQIDRSVVQTLAGNQRRAEDIDRAIATIAQLVELSVAAMETFDKQTEPSMLDLKRLGQVRLKSPKLLGYAVVQQVAARLGVNVADIELADLHRNSGWLKFNETIAAATRKDLRVVEEHIGAFVSVNYEQPPRPAA